MTLESKTVIINNIYVVRFKMLYSFYEDYFYSKYDHDELAILEYLKNELDVNSIFLSKNMEYLLAGGYLGDRGDMATISYKGIKFIENITSGEFDYTHDMIKTDQDHIINMFQKGDTLG